VKSFTERNPYIIGGLIILMIVVGTSAALLLNGGFFKDQYSVYGEFKDAAGIVPMAKVKVAGIDVGVVGSIKTVTLTKSDGTRVPAVRIQLKVDHGVKLPLDSTAEIKVDTLLGSKAVIIKTGGDWDHRLGQGGHNTIGLDRTRTPIDLLQLQNTATPLLQQSDAKALNSLFQQLSAVSEGKSDDVRQILQGLDRLTTVINDRQGEASQLIDSTRTLSQTLASRDQDLISAVQQLDRLTTLLVQRRTELAALLQSTADATARLAALIHQNRPALDNVINELHNDLVILSNHQMDLAQSVSLLGAAIKGFASVGYSGPTNYPNRWANIYAQLLGPTDQDAIYGSCGVIDKALDLALGQDPLACSKRSGSLPAGVTGQTAGTAAPARLGETVPLSAFFAPLVTR